MWNWMKHASLRWQYQPIPSMIITCSHCTVNWCVPIFKRLVDLHRKKRINYSNVWLSTSHELGIHTMVCMSTCPSSLTTIISASYTVRCMQCSWTLNSVCLRCKCNWHWKNLRTQKRGSFRVRQTHSLKQSFQSNPKVLLSSSTRSPVDVWCSLD